MVIGSGVTGSTSAAFTKLVDEFASCADLPGTTLAAVVIEAETPGPQKTLGSRSFTGFLKSRDGASELQEDGLDRPVRLRDRG